MRATQEQQQFASSYWKRVQRLDPQTAFGGLDCLLSLDTHAIYGASVWMIYKDVCQEDIVKTIAALRAVQLGLLDEDKHIHAIQNRGKGIDVDGLVKERLPSFDARLVKYIHHDRQVGPFRPYCLIQSAWMIDAIETDLFI
ncbi:hypothetical protein KAR91_11010 [Candidatus Pacearchaeota archaeon]|nr:hypothetical protein [Candidatus Pacearchaeota archaeon]